MRNIPFDSCGTDAGLKSEVASRERAPLQFMQPAVGLSCRRLLAASRAVLHQQDNGTGTSQTNPVRHQID